MIQSVPITDEELVAYLDGALDLERHREIEAALAHDELLAARIARLDIDTDSIRAAFGMIEDVAPVAQLRTRLEQDLSRVRRVRQWPRIAAALIVGVGLGLGMGLGPAFLAAKDWRVAVADYQVLYTTATLASIGGDAANQRGEVATVTGKLQLPIAVDALQVAGLTFKRAQLLQFEGQPLAQFAYLDQAGTPFAFCVTRTGNADSEIQTGKLHGLSAASWNKNGYGFIVIGGTQDETVRRAAVVLQARI